MEDARRRLSQLEMFDVAAGLDRERHHTRNGAGREWTMVSRVIAAIDIGSNSIKMTIARVDAAGAIDEFVATSETVRLGAGLDTTGRLAADRIEAAMETLARFAATARAHGATRIIGVATEATRVATNGPAFLARLDRETGIEIRSIGGAEEATLTFRGLAAKTDVSGDLVVADIGGGSTELIVAHDGEVQSSSSLPLGSGRLTEQLVVANPPTGVELVACRNAAATMMRPIAERTLEGPVKKLRLLIVGGTGEYLARLVADPRRIDSGSIAHVLATFEEIPSPRLATQLQISELRARVLPAGVAIVDALEALFRPITIDVARSGIRTGLLIDAVGAEAGSGRQEDP